MNELPLALLSLELGSSNGITLTMIDYFFTILYNHHKSIIIIYIKCEALAKHSLTSTSPWLQVVPP